MKHTELPSTDICSGFWVLGLGVRHHICFHGGGDTRQRKLETRLDGHGFKLPLYGLATQ